MNDVKSLEAAVAIIGFLENNFVRLIKGVSFLDLLGEKEKVKVAGKIIKRSQAQVDFSEW